MNITDLAGKGADMAMPDNERAALVKAISNGLYECLIGSQSYRLAKIDIEKKREEKRVKELIRGDAEYRRKEQVRTQALKEIEGGGVADASLINLGPTPEWMRHYDTQAFSARRDGHWSAGNEGSTVRRVITPVAMRMHRKGNLSDEHLAACIWFRNTYEQTGLEGSVASVDYSREVFVMPDNKGMRITERQADARNAFRAAIINVQVKDRILFTQVVLSDKALYSLEREYGLSRMRIKARFLAACDAVYQIYHAINQANSKKSKL